MAARLVQELPVGNDWMYEVKFDGYRALIIKSADKVQIRSRNNKDMTALYPGAHAAALKLRAGTVVLDGEIVAVDASGHPSFQALQHRGAHPDHAILFYAFDVLNLEGKDLTRLPLTDRRRQLAKTTKGSGVLISEELHGAPDQIIEAVRGLGLEGIVAKRRDSRYEPGQRSGSWLKLKLDKQQEFIVGGYRPGGHGVDALLVGFHDPTQLRFAGKVRAGFTPHVRREVFAALAGLHSTRCPFVDLPNSKTSHWGGGVTAEQMGEMQWLKPRALAQVRFVEWTEDGHLRHAVFLGLRVDKDAANITREEGR